MTKDYPLHEAIKKQDIKNIQTLLEENNEGIINQLNQTGQTPLIALADSTKPREQGNALQIADLLLKNGADISVADNNGNTALHLATKKGVDQLVKQFIENGADPKVKNNFNESSIDIYKENVEDIKDLNEEVGVSSPRQRTEREGAFAMYRGLPTEKQNNATKEALQEQYRPGAEKAAQELLSNALDDNKAIDGNVAENIVSYLKGDDLHNIIATTKAGYEAAKEQPTYAEKIAAEKINKDEQGHSKT